MGAYEVKVKANLDTSEAKKQLKELQSGKHTLKLKVDVDSDLSSTLNKLSAKTVKVKIDSDLTSLKKVQSNLSQMKKNVNSFKIDVDVSKANSAIQKFSGQTTRSLEQARRLLNQINKDYTNVKFAPNDRVLLEYYPKLQEHLTQYQNKMKMVKIEAQDLSNASAKIVKSFNQLDASIASNKTMTWLKNNSKAAKDYGDVLEDLAQKQKRSTSSEELADYSKQVRRIQTEAMALGKTGKSFGDEFSRAFEQIFQFSQIYGGIDRVINSIGNAIIELKEVDNILTEISKVSDMSSSALKQLGEDAFDYANKYGKTVTDYLDGVAEMNRSGFYGQQGIDLANTSVLAQAAGDMNAEVANAYLLATNAAYEYEGSAKKLNAVLDGQNMITNRNSVNMADMAEATSQAGSMAAQTGVEIEQLSALIGTAVSRTKKSGNEIGTALKSLFINLTNTSNKKIVGTFDDLDISMTKMVGDTELLKTPVELIKELSEAYNTLPDGSVRKQNILTNIGGKHYANVLSAILSGYDDYEKMLQDYSEGMGSAEREAEKSANNWQGSLNKLSNSWTKFIKNFADSDTITGALQGINGLLTGINSLIDTVGVLPTVLGGAGVVAFFKNLDWGKSSLQSYSLLLSGSIIVEKVA